MYVNLLNKSPCPELYRLLADAGFPNSLEYKEKILRVPKKNEMNDLVLNEETFDRFKAITKHRQAAEWGMRAIQSGFGRLSLPLSEDDKATRVQLLHIIWRLHNFRTRLVGINPISTVYFKKWQDDRNNNGFRFF
ncbi:hypothetical protein BD408DRAFT_419666 [Parasitella parasitica]|nr:hypothetical protein BD408DRAFT_419666 [Parasitella parasitica]